jgi:endogenous inhibitor of DNA gyrase (YacG/DUF329 family)
MLKCKRCGKELTGKQTSWCSQRCSRLGLKALYKKRNRDKINAYNRKYRKNKREITKKKKSIYRKNNKGGYKTFYFDENKKCYFCGSEKNLQKHHLDYDKNLVVYLCKDCHIKHHKLIKSSGLSF